LIDFEYEEISIIDNSIEIQMEKDNNISTNLKRHQISALNAKTFNEASNTTNKFYNNQTPPKSE
jgi:hypothetical protein